MSTARKIYPSQYQEVITSRDTRKTAISKEVLQETIGKGAANSIYESLLRKGAIEDDGNIPLTGVYFLLNHYAQKGSRLRETPKGYNVIYNLMATLPPFIRMLINEPAALKAAPTRFLVSSSLGEGQSIFIRAWHNAYMSIGNPMNNLPTRGRFNQSGTFTHSTYEIISSIDNRIIGRLPIHTETYTAFPPTQRLLRRDGSSIMMISTAYLDEGQEVRLPAGLKPVHSSQHQQVLIHPSLLGLPVSEFEGTA